MNTCTHTYIYIYMSYVAVSPFHYCFPHPNTTSSQITWIYVDILGYRTGNEPGPFGLIS